MMDWYTIYTIATTKQDMATGAAYIVQADNRQEARKVVTRLDKRKMQYLHWGDETPEKAVRFISGHRGNICILHYMADGDRVPMWVQGNVYR